jgi:uncharacterized damage-inducible protein DinB
MSMKLLLGFACIALLAPAQAPAQQPANPLVAGQEAVYSTVKNNLIRAAEKMPEENYSFRPTPEVMSFAEMVGHVADSQYTYCYSVTGQRLPAPGLQKAKKTKAELVEGLKQAFSLCDQAIAGLTDAKALELVPLFGRQQPRLTILTFNTAHNDEHYGNLVTYMRMKGLVPPSSEGRK